MISFKDKIFGAEQWPEALEHCHANTIVFTNGCFDILHPGHIQYLEEAAQLGDKLVVGLNGDASVTRLKGTQRPINDFDFRAKMLAALGSVNLVIEFGEDTPMALIEMIKPKVLVKGGDYKIDEVVGRELVESLGGRVALIPFVGNYSTSDIINKLKNS